MKASTRASTLVRGTHCVHLGRGSAHATKSIDFESDTAPDSEIQLLYSLLTVLGLQPVMQDWNCHHGSKERRCTLQYSGHQTEAS